MSGEQTTTESECLCDVDCCPGFDVEFCLNHHTLESITQQQQHEITDNLTQQLEQAERYFEDVLRQSHVDLVEVCAPWDSPLCRAVRECGGTAIALGVHNGFDLLTTQGYRKAIDVIRKLRPRYVHISPPCHLWSPFQNCTKRTEQQWEEFLGKRKVSKKLIERCCRLLEIQMFELDGHGGQSHDVLENSQRHGGGEHPLRAQSWQQTSLGKLAKQCGGRFTVHGCCHGMIHWPTKKLLQKPWGWFSSSPHVRHALESRCTHASYQHVPIEGAVTPTTAVYPQVLCRRFAKAILRPSVPGQMFQGTCALGEQHIGPQTRTTVCWDSLQTAPVLAEELRQDYWTQRNGVLIRHHVQPRRNLFTPQNGDCPVSVDQLGSQRVTWGQCDDGDIQEMEDDWRNPQESPFGDKQWTGETKFYVQMGNPPRGFLESEGDDGETLHKIRLIHRNLGHPNRETMLRLFRDAGASPQVLNQVKQFTCEHCLQRGTRAATRPAVAPPIREKWECVSIDTFWWHTPNQLLAAGETGEYVIGLSILDEATDFHTCVLIRTWNQTQRNISSQEFKQAFGDGWLKTFPVPKRLRYDEEGFLRNMDMVHWLETFGVKLEPIAGESGWQLGKHSRHLQVLKENVN